MQLTSATVTLLVLWALDVSAAALRARLTPLQDDCNLPEGDPQGADCNTASADAIVVRQDLPLGLTSIVVGRGTTTSATTLILSLPYTANLNPEGAASGSGTLVLSAPITSARLSSGDVSESSSGAFSEASCDFYVGSSSVSGLVACTGDIVGHGETPGVVTLSGTAECVACGYTTGLVGTVDE